MAQCIDKQVPVTCTITYIELMVCQWFVNVNVIPHGSFNKETDHFTYDYCLLYYLSLCLPEDYHNVFTEVNLLLLVIQKRPKKVNGQMETINA